MPFSSLCCGTSVCGFFFYIYPSTHILYIRQLLLYKGNYKTVKSQAPNNLIKLLLLFPLWQLQVSLFPHWMPYISTFLWHKVKTIFMCFRFFKSVCGLKCKKNIHESKTWKKRGVYCQATGRNKQRQNNNHIHILWVEGGGRKTTYSTKASLTRART